MAKSKAEINFPGSINDIAQSVQFLFSPELPSIQIRCLITAKVKLVDLQNAIALLDWRYWEQLRNSSDAPLEFLVQWKENNYTKHVKATEVVKEDRLKLGDLIFLGTEFQWQELALRQTQLPSACPIVLEEEPGRNTYEVSSSLLPPSGTKVALILRASRE